LEFIMKPLFPRIALVLASAAVLGMGSHAHAQGAMSGDAGSSSSSLAGGGWLAASAAPAAGVGKAVRAWA
jgi:hypothetical protein